MRRARDTTALGDGTVLVRGDWIGVLHLNNQRVATLHRRVVTPMALGLAFKRDILTSLRYLAGLAGPDARLAGVQAFTVVTILYHGLPRLGFEFDAHRVRSARFIGVYQRALLATLHPDGRSRTALLAPGAAEQLWLSRRRLLTLYAERTLRVG
jgi:hypothetical protein